MEFGLYFEVADLKLLDFRVKKTLRDDFVEAE